MKKSPCVIFAPNPAERADRPHHFSFAHYDIAVNVALHLRVKIWKRGEFI